MNILITSILPFIPSRTCTALTSDADIDYESTPNLTLTISVIDGGGLSITKHFGVVVVDVNEAPYELNITRNEVGPP